MKKKITVRFSEDEIQFIEEMKTRGINPSTLIRFCLNFVMFIKDKKEFVNLIKKLPKDKYV